MTRDLVIRRPRPRRLIRSFHHPASSCRPSITSLSNPTTLSVRSFASLVTQTNMANISQALAALYSHVGQFPRLSCSCSAAGASKVNRIGRHANAENRHQPALQFFDLVALLLLEFRSECISSSICSDAIPRIESTTIDVDVHLPSLIASHDLTSLNYHVNALAASEPQRFQGSNHLRLAVGS
jgi:hypothetical protein